MAENENSQEKTEQPTPKRLEDARKKGQVARSRELTMTLVMLAAAAYILFDGQRFATHLAEVMRAGFAFDLAILEGERALLVYLAGQVRLAMVLLLPLLLVLLLAAVAAPALIGGWNFSLQAVQPKFERLDPVKGLKRVFGPKGLMELVKTLAKFLVVGAAAFVFMLSVADRFAGLGALSIKQAISEATHMAALGLAVVSATLILIALIDVPFQLHQHTKQLRMTRQEVRDELKQTEGKPEVKSKIRQLQQSVAGRRMLEAVPRADIVVTNPSHFAVAIRYQSEQMQAPVVVAKGADLVAAVIRRTAEEAGVPILQSPPLARALFHSTDIGQMIPPGLYLAVAEVLTWVYQIRGRPERAGTLKPPTIDLDESEWVPARFRPRQR